MKIETKSAAVRKALREVEDRIAPELWRTLAAAVTWIRCSLQYEQQGFGGRVPVSAGLYPLWEKINDIGNSRVRPKMQLIVFLPVFRRFGHCSRVGILAHEFAHVYDALARRGNWHTQMQRRYEQGEKAADLLAISWGFAKEIESMRKEREVLNARYWANMILGTV